MRRDFKTARRAGKPGTNSQILQREVTLINRQRQVRLPVSRLRAFLSRLDGLLDLGSRGVQCLLCR